MRIALCGPSGPIAEGLLERLEDDDLGIESLHAFAREPADDASLRFAGKTRAVHSLADADFGEVDVLVLFEALDSLDTLVEAANAAGCHIIDASLSGSRAGRVVVPELMQDERVDYPVFWSVPDPVVSALAPVLDGMLVGNSLQSVSALVCEPAAALGESGTQQLAKETARLLNGQPASEDKRQQLAFNLIPGDYPEKEYWRQTLADILGSEFPVLSLERLQVPLFYGQTLQLRVELEHPLALEDVAGAWREHGLHLIENIDKFSPAALVEDDRIHLGKLELNSAGRHSVSVWIIADNVRKSAIVNITSLIQILIKSSI